MSSRFLEFLLKETKDHHEACGCGPCCALSGWSAEDEVEQLKKEKSDATKTSKDSSRS